MGLQIICKTVIIYIFFLTLCCFFVLVVIASYLKASASIVKISWLSHRAVSGTPHACCTWLTRHQAPGPHCLWQDTSHKCGHFRINFPRDNSVVLWKCCVGANELQSKALGLKTVSMHTPFLLASSSQLYLFFVVLYLFKSEIFPVFCTGCH